MRLSLGHQDWHSLVIFWALINNIDSLWLRFEYFCSYFHPLNASSPWSPGRENK